MGNEPENIQESLEEKHAQMVAERAGVPFIRLSLDHVNPLVVGRYAEEDIRNQQLLPYAESAGITLIATADPALAQAQSIPQNLGAKGRLRVVTKCNLEALITAYFSGDLGQKITIQEKVLYDENQDIAAGFAALKELPTREAWSHLRMLGMAARASDIHLQATAEGLFVRFRVAGILKEIGHINREKASPLRDQIKYDCGAKVNIHHVPQDGHMTFLANEREVELRLSTLPTPHGESLALRVLDTQKGIQSFPELGFSAETITAMTAAAQRKSGIMLITGPTGSGKTTTLYTLLSQLNTPGVKIVTLEDPVEYRLPGIVQSEISPPEYTFENGLKALLRHDPDIILLGEIRTGATAALAAEAAMTGHLVLSTLHTNDAKGAFTRLRHFGLQAYQIEESVRLVVAQRLVREVNPKTAETKTIQEIPALKALTKRHKTPPNTAILHAAPEDAYGPRMAVSEYLFAPGETPKRTLWDDAFAKLIQQKTTYQECVRVLGLPL